MVFARRFVSLPLALAVIALALAGAGVWVTVGAGGDAVRRHVVAGGVPLDEVHPAAGGRRPGVVVAHGFAGSARLMRQFGDVLAARGYVIVLLDFSGHGANTRPLGDDAGLQRDLGVAMAHLRGLPDVDPSLVAVVGHSMGAGAAVRYGAAHPDVTATVAISLPDASDVRPGLPRRLLLLVGAAEFAGFRDAAERAASVGGGSVGGDRAAVVVPGVEHVSILWAPRTHREVVAWLDDAFGAPQGVREVPSPLRRLVGAGLLVAAFILGFVPLVRVALGGTAAPLPWISLPDVARAAAVTGAASVVAALVAAVVPSDALPLAIGGYLVAFTTLTGLALAGWHRWHARRVRPATVRPATVRPATVTAHRWAGARAALAAVVLAGYAGAAIAVPLHLGVIQAIPVGPRWWLLVLSWVGFTVLAYGAGGLTGGSGSGLLAVSAVATIVLAVAAVAGLTSGFVLLVVPLLAALMVWQAAWADVLRRYSAPLWLAAPVGALVVAWPIAVALPLTS